MMYNNNNNYQQQQIQQPVQQMPLQPIKREYINEGYIRLRV